LATGGGWETNGKKFRGRTSENQEEQICAREKGLDGVGRALCSPGKGNGSLENTFKRNVSLGNMKGGTCKHEVREIGEQRKSLGRTAAVEGNNGTEDGMSWVTLCEGRWRNRNIEY